MQNQPPASTSGIHSAFNPAIQGLMQQAYQDGHSIGFFQGYQVGFIYGEASAAQRYFPVSLPQASQQPHTSHNIQPAASSSTQQLVPQPPQGVAVAGTSGVQSGYSRDEDNKFTCNNCEYSTKIHTDIKTHIKTHTEEKPFECSTCQKRFAKSNTLTVHMRTHTGEKPYKCQYCEYAAVQKSDVKKHERTHTGETPFKCDFCEYQGIQRSNLYSHIKSKHTPQPPAHSSVDEDYLQCEQGQIQQSSAQLATRTISPVSTQGSSSSETGSDSETSHASHPVPVASTSAEPTASSSTQQSTLPAPQPVAVAGTSGVKSEYIKQADMTFKCNECDYSTKQHGHMKYHVRTHTKEKPYQCKVCNKSFPKQYTLKVHERIHTGEKPYKCQHCDYAAKQAAHLGVHMRTKHQPQQAAESDTNQPPAKKTKTE